MHMFGDLRVSLVVHDYHMFHTFLPQLIVRLSLWLDELVGTQVIMM